jgi:hypothetical protein
MGIFTKLAQQIFASVDENGNARSISEQEAAVWGTELERAVSLFISSGGLIYPSKTALDDDVAHGASAMAWVLGDPVVANNGVYGKVGASGTGSWARRGDLPFSFIIASDAGAGTPNALQATTSIPVSGSALVWMNIFEANTGSPVTVSFNGGTPLTIKTNSGNDIAAGGLAAGMIVLGIVSGTSFRLLSDQASSAVVAAAETEANRAKTEADRAQTYAAGVQFPVSYAAQSLSTAQQEQARQNIGIGAYAIGGYGVFMPETRPWLEYIWSHGLSEPRRSFSYAVDAAVEEIVDSGAWALLDYLGVWFGPSWALSRVSLKSPGAVMPDFTGGDLFVPGVGVKGDPTNYVLFDKSPSQLSQFKRNSASVGLMVSGGTSVLNGASIVGGAGTAGFTLRPVDASNNQSVRLNQSTALVTAAGFRDGFAAGSRTSANDIANYRDGAKIGASAASPTTTDPSTAKMTVFAPAEDRAAHAYFVGGGLTDDQIFAINSAIQTLRSRIGAF